ncbi:MAG TPA: hypothetical protein VNM48_04970 [Chloroflexota bacterium]|nr:hypothetical protein [Chloroflexota bacterium]
MPSVEGLWSFQTNSHDDPDRYVYGGVVVLETGRAFGGDSAMAHVGDYTVSGDGLTATLRSWQWNKEFDGENVFGMESPNIDYMVRMEARRVGEELVGYICPLDQPDQKLGIRMHFISNLPG